MNANNDRQSPTRPFRRWAFLVSDTSAMFPVVTLNDLLIYDTSRQADDHINFSSIIATPAPTPSSPRIARLPFLPQKFNNLLAYQIRARKHQVMTDIRNNFRFYPRRHIIKTLNSLARRINFLIAPNQIKNRDIDTPQFEYRHWDCSPCKPDEN